MRLMSSREDRFHHPSSIPSFLSLIKYRRHAACLLQIFTLAGARFDGRDGGNVEFVAAEIAYGNK